MRDEFTGTLSGTRYSANGIQAENATQKLRQEYTINVSAEKSAGAKAVSQPASYGGPRSRLPPMAY